MGKITMMLREINFGDVDAKNEILKQNRANENLFIESFSMPHKVSINDIMTGQKYVILGLKGTGKTALLRYVHDLCVKKGAASELILFKSHVTEEDRQSLSNSSGFEVITTGDAPAFVQDFKEAWKWMLYQRIGKILSELSEDSSIAKKYCKITGTSEGNLFNSIGALFSRIKAGSINLSTEAFGAAVEIGLDIGSPAAERRVSISDLNRACSALLNKVNNKSEIYIFLDELELFHQTPEQFDRDRRILRDLIYAISQINADSAENGRKLFLVTSLRTEVLHSVLELGHEIGRDIDDFGIRLDWSDGKASIDHPLLNLISKKISMSSKVPQDEVWNTFFPQMINNQIFFQFILTSSYYRPRDIVRLLRVARDFRDTDAKFTTEHFEKSAIEYSKQTWLEITEELLASYSSPEILAMQRLFLGFSTLFFKDDLNYRAITRYRDDLHIQTLIGRKGITTILADLYRIGVIGNDFIVKNPHGKTLPRNRWIFRGNTTLNDSERMAVHKSLWKHLSLVPGVSR
jgi:hypothetical protein